MAMDLVRRVVAGDRVAAARLISLIENGAPEAEPLLQELLPGTGRAHVVGITGAPGSGKSTLVSRLAKVLRARNKRVGIVAVDPTSPFTGGALLGDRVRMQSLTGDPGIFIRSMASRGSLGGISQATTDAVKVLDAFGCHVVLVETVGAGQGEVEIARMAHTTVVVEVPGMGDGIQVIKAGILEAADLFVVNKADKIRADQLAAELTSMLAMRDGDDGWVPPVLKTVATTGSGIGLLADALDAHRSYLMDSGEMERRCRDNALRELLNATKQRFIEDLWSELGEGEILAMAGEVAERHLSSRSAAVELVDRFRRNGQGR